MTVTIITTDKDGNRVAVEIPEHDVDDEARAAHAKQEAAEAAAPKPKSKPSGG